MTHHDADEVVPPGPLQQRVMIGRVTQLHRPDRVAEEGDTFEINGAGYEIVDVTERTVGDVDIGTARQEVADNLNQYRQRMQMLDPDFEWADDTTLFRYRFSRRLNVGEE